jgi:RNA polymerase sigma-70 factor (ECF subfamily)
MSESFEEALAAHRPELLRHCYRMLGSFQDAEETVQEALVSAWNGREGFTGAAPLHHWLFRIATNACLNARKKRRRTLPDLQSPPALAGAAVGEPIDPDSWVTPAPDDALYPTATATDAARILEERETIALAFVALLQRLPPRQRAVLLLKDVVGFSSEEIADALDLSTPSVSSALHRARATVPTTARGASYSDPAPEVLREYIRCWEARDLDGLLALLRKDVVFTMPPFAIWFQGRHAVERFLTSPRFAAFWSSGIRLLPTRANGQVALVFYRNGGQVRHSIQLLRFDGVSFGEVCNLVGETYLRGFHLPQTATKQFRASALS